MLLLGSIKIMIFLFSINYHKRRLFQVYSNEIRSMATISNILPKPIQDIYAKEVEDLTNFVADKSRIAVITGAGISTDSNIPDYRGVNGSYKYGHKPMVHLDFIMNEKSRKRYWARSILGYKEFQLAQPNSGHFALAILQKNNKVGMIVTQNVDRLHQKAGSVNVVDLHGRNDIVECLSCKTESPRRILQKKIEDINPEITKNITAYYNEMNLLNQQIIRADGDSNLDGVVDYDNFCIPNCPRCSSGILMPQVIFFGNNVPVQRVENVYSELEKCDGLLVIGTSLEVFSAYRFVDKAAKLNIPIAIVNNGETRADRSNIKLHFRSNNNDINMSCGKILKDVTNNLNLT